MVSSPLLSFAKEVNVYIWCIIDDQCVNSRIENATKEQIAPVIIPNYVESIRHCDDVHFATGLVAILFLSENGELDKLLI